MATTYNLTPGTLASTCYPASAQTLNQEIISKATITLNIQGVIIQETTPGSSDRDKLWIQIDGSGFPKGHFKFQSGSWVWPHEVPASSAVRQIWIGSTAGLQTFDGGAAVAVSDTTGPFWEVDSNFQDRIPIGAGGTLAATVDTNYGDADASITIDSTNLPEHFHFTVNNTQINTGALLTSGGFTAYIGGGQGQENYVLQESSSDANVGKTSTVGESSPTDLNILNPVRAVYIIKRTSRIYRTPV